ncbi:hypothetical protein [Candidatus Kuenenia sp.]|uniref:hypothetical protein n=1 Tax=Candidatus Kuenenia sp. TaxID=2499824 RepID=UPI00321F6C8E
MVETTINEDTTLKTPKERKGSYLDRGFLTGKVLLVILGVVFFLQGISAWKIINLEREKASFEAEKQNFNSLKEQLPELQKIISDLEGKKAEFQGEVNILKSDANALEIKRNQFMEDVKHHEQKLNKLKSDNESYENKLKTSENLLRERKKLCDNALVFQKKLNDESSALESKIMVQTSDVNTLQERINKLQEEEKALTVKIVRLETREDELQKMNTEFSNVIVNLKTGSTQFEQYQNEAKVNLKSANQTFEDATQNMRSSAAKLDHEVAYLKGVAENLGNKVNLSADTLKTNIEKLSSISVQSNKLIDTMVEGMDKLKQRQTVLDDTTQNIRGSVTKLDQEVINLKNTTNDLCSGANQSTNTLKMSIEQLSSASAQSSKLLDTMIKETDSFQQKQVAIVEIQNRFATTLKQIESSVENFTSDKLGLQETYRKLKGEASDAIKKIEELREVNLKLQKEFDGLRKTVNTLPRDDESKATKQ